MYYRIRAGTALIISEVIWFNRFIVCTLNIHTNFSCYLIVNRNGTLAKCVRCNLRKLPDITLSGNVGIFYWTADQITGLSGQLPDTW